MKALAQQYMRTVEGRPLKPSGHQGGRQTGFKDVPDEKHSCAETSKSSNSTPCFSEPQYEAHTANQKESDLSSEHSTMGFVFIKTHAATQQG